MSYTTIGLIVGLVLGVIAVTQGFLAFLAVGFIAGIGLIIGLILDGKIDIGAVMGRERSGR